jgi:beta-glucoside operon transcriptional antiterminator
MKITQILNNNSLIAIDDHGRKVVLIGKGFAYGKKVGEHTSAESADIYYQQGKPTSTNEDIHIAMAKQISNQAWAMTDVVMRYIHKKLGRAASPLISLGLANQIQQALVRHQHGSEVPLSILEEVKVYYPKIYAVAEWIRDYLSATLDIDLPASEIGFFAVEIISVTNIEVNLSQVKQLSYFVDKVDEILANNDLFQYLEPIVQVHLNIYLRRLGMRCFTGKQMPSLGGVELHFDARILHRAQPILDEINMFMQKTYHQELSEYEYDHLMMYLVQAQQGTGEDLS